MGGNGFISLPPQCLGNSNLARILSPFAFGSRVFVRRTAFSARLLEAAVNANYTRRRSCFISSKDRRELLDQTSVYRTRLTGNAEWRANETNFLRTEWNQAPPAVLVLSAAVVPGPRPRPPLSEQPLLDFFDWEGPSG